MSARKQSRARRYPPLLVVVVALALAVFALPSALNLPMANPGQSVEYAPVPGNNPGLAQGNLAALGLGSSNAASGGLAQPPPPQLSNAGANPSTKQCVGNPPRQTEDPLSPPCVAFFNGDNGGATYQGVSAREVRVVAYIDSGTYYATMSQGQETYPADSYYDAEQPAGASLTFDRLLHDFQIFFNARYQTYGRLVHIIVHFSSGGANASSSSRAADAAEDVARVRPFATLVWVNSNAETYLARMNQSGVLAFLGNPAGGSAGAPLEPASYYAGYPGLVWSFTSSIDILAANFVSHACTKLLPYAVSYTGNPADMSKPRVLGALWTVDSGPNSTDRSGHSTHNPGLQYYSQQVRKGLLACGAHFADEEYTNDNPSSIGCGDNQAAALRVAGWRRAGVTTVIRVGGATECETAIAAAAGDYPEWLMAGDFAHDTAVFAKFEDQNEWRHVRVVSGMPAVASLESQPCYAALRDADPSIPTLDIQNWGCGFYPDIRELFIGIQVAGPRLTPAAMDQGYHAIPRVLSTVPTIPTCYYDAGDYTCVKDEQVEWWDPSGQSGGSGSQPGCWRMMQAGQRYVAGNWPPGDVERQRDAKADPCNVGDTVG